MKFIAILKRQDPPPFTRIRKAVSIIKEATRDGKQQQRDAKADNTGNA